jgi:hypothetical protein
MTFDELKSTPLVRGYLIENDLMGADQRTIIKRLLADFPRFMALAHTVDAEAAQKAFDELGLD